MLIRNHPNSVTAKNLVEQNRAWRRFATQYQVSFLGQLSTESRPHSLSITSNVIPSSSHYVDDIDQFEFCYRLLAVLRSAQSVYPGRTCSYLADRTAWHCFKTIIQSLFKTGWIHFLSTISRQYPLFVPVAIMYFMRHIIFTFKTSGIRGVVKLSMKSGRFVV